MDLSYHLTTGNSDLIDDVRSKGIITDSQLFVGLKSEEIAGILENAYEKEFETNQVIIKEGDPLKGLSIIIDGEASIQKKNNMTGKIVELKIRGKGESLGEMTLIDSGAASVTVRAKSDVKIAIINLKYLTTAFKENPRMRGDVAINIAKILSKRLRQATAYSAAKTGLKRY